MPAVRRETRVHHQCPTNAGDAFGIGDYAASERDGTLVASVLGGFIYEWHLLGERRDDGPAVTRKSHGATKRLGAFMKHTHGAAEMK